jgi:hypothetical protein
MRRSFKLIALAALVGCGRAQRTPATIPSQERGFVAAIADHAQDKWKMRIDVDPAPLPDSLDVVGQYITRATFVTGEADGVMRALFETAVRALPEREREQCPGLVDDRDPDLEKKLAGCPKESHTLLVIGTPKRDTVAVTTAARRGAPIPDNRRWVRTLEKTMYPRGPGNLTVADYIIERDTAGWRVVERIERIHFDVF